ncbi:hypothetical protein A6R68_10947, partial [Neotoma lepida]
SLNSFHSPIYSVGACRCCLGQTPRRTRCSRGGFFHMGYGGDNHFRLLPPSLQEARALLRQRRPRGPWARALLKRRPPHRAPAGQPRDVSPRPDVRTPTHSLNPSPAFIHSDLFYQV